MKLEKLNFNSFTKSRFILFFLVLRPLVVYSQTCNCDQVLVPGSNLNDMTPGTTYCVMTGTTWSGNINQLQTGSTICIQEGATFLPSGVDANGLYSGDIINHGVANFSGVSNWPIKTDNMVITNYNNMVINGFQLDQKLIFENLGLEANLTITGSFDFKNGAEITNEGTLTSQANFKSTTGTSINNTGILSSEQDINIGGRFYNNGYVKALGTININTGADVYNDCTFYSEKEFKTSSNTIVVNQGLIYVDDKVGSDQDQVIINGEFEHNGIFYAENFEFQANTANPFYGTDGLIYITGGSNSSRENSNTVDFYGSVPSLPIIVYDRNYVNANCSNTGAGQCIFENNQSNHTYTNVIRETIDPGEPAVPSFLINDCSNLFFTVDLRDTLCVDSTTEILTAINVGDNYIWSTNETTSSISISPTIETIYTVTVTINNPPSITIEEHVAIPGIPPSVFNDTISTCASSTGTYNFDLESATVTNEIGQTITYYSTYQDAVDRTNPLPIIYNTSGCETVYSRVTDDDICFSIAEIYLNVHPLPQGGIVTKSIVLCPGESVLPIEFCGPANGTITYTDGTSIVTVNLDGTGNATSNVTFTSTTTFQIVDVSNSTCTYTY